MERLIGSVVSLGIFGAIAIGAMVVGTSEGNEAISEMQAAEAAMCACDAGDFECGMRAQAMIESLAARHMNTEGSDLQLARFEKSVDRTMACADRVFGGF